MAITPTLYATADEYRAVFGSQNSLDENARVEAALAAVSDLVANECGRFFGKDDAPVARIYLPTVTSRTLFVGDLAAAPTVVKIDTDNDGDFADEEAVTGFEAWPLEAAYAAEPRPYYEVHLPSWASQGAFIAGQRVQVTAVRGWPAVPNGIKRATIELAGMLLMQSPRSTSRYDETIGSFVSSSREARGLIERLKQQYALDRSQP